MRISGTVQVYDNVRRLMGAGLDFTKQKFSMLLCGPGYIYSGAHVELTDITDECDGLGYRREAIKFDWQESGPEMKLMFDPVVFLSRGAPYRVGRWVIYRIGGSGALLFSGQVGEMGNVTMTEGDDLEIAPESSGLLRLA